MVRQRLSELKFRNLFDSMEEGFSSCRMIYSKAGKPIDFRYLYVNPAFSKQTGIKVEQVVGRTVRQVIPKIEQFWIDTYDGVVQSGKTEQFESEVAAIGKQFEIKVWRSSPGCFAVIFSDVTNRRKKEAMLETKAIDLKRANQLQAKTTAAMLNVMEDLERTKALAEIERAKDEAMLASIGEGLIAVDDKRRVVVVNKSAEEMLGWKQKDLLGQEITKLPLQDEQGRILPPTDRPTSVALATGEITRVNAYFMRKDKTRFPIAVTSTPVKLDGKTIGLVDIIRDITRESEIDRAKSEFVSLASHQLRTPLGIMKWYMEALGYEDYFKKAPLAIREYMDQINKSNERVLSLVRDLLSVSRIDQGRVKDDPKPVDVVAVVKEVVEQMQILARKNKVALHLTIQDQKILPLSIDVLRFHEVMENLIANAIEYTKSAGSVDVTIDKRGKVLIIHVKDTGIGISPADQKKLYTKFFRSEKAVEQNPEGSGLGLYVVKSYVEGWGGKISVHSAEGTGSTFTVSLPILKHQHIKGNKI